MSLGDEGERSTLRAMAHPLRLQIMSLLTGAAMTAAEVARELGLTHANASYHLRNLFAAGLIVQAGEEKIRGGVAKRYRYLADERDRGPEGRSTLVVAHGNELLRRAASGDFSGRVLLGDAELWIEPDEWVRIRGVIADALRELHEAARPPRTPGTVRTSTTVAMFEMESE